MQEQALVVCIGNDLAADDGVGREIFLELQKRTLPENVRLVFLGLGGIDLIEQLGGEKRLIVVDAVQFGEPAGTVHTLDWDSLPQMVPRPVSGHGIGVREAIEVCRKLHPEKIPELIWLVGVEGECFDQLGAGLSFDVQRAVTKAVDVIFSLLK